MFEIERIAEDPSKVVVGLDPACFDGPGVANSRSVLRTFLHRCSALRARHSQRVRFGLQHEGDGGHGAGGEVGLRRTTSIGSGSAGDSIA